MRLSVLIASRDRREILLETLRRIVAQSGDSDVEVIVVADGCTDGTAAAVRSLAAGLRSDLRVLEVDSRGLGAARNAALEAAGGDACLFLGDDTRPLGDVLARHARFHSANAEKEAALLGRVIWSQELAPTPFMEWLMSDGIQFEYGELRAADEVVGRYFYTAHISAKTGFLRDVGGFDESFTTTLEDIDLGLRLERAGMRLVYEPTAVVEHYHPVALDDTLRRVRLAGASSVRLSERHAGWPIPRRPSARHRAKAAALIAANLAGGGRLSPVQRATWRFLCHEAYREGYWLGESGPRRIGAALTRLARRDPATRSPTQLAAA